MQISLENKVNEKKTFVNGYKNIVFLFKNNLYPKVITEDV